MARFKLIHLTPRTREAFRAYRDVQRTLNGLSLELDTARRYRDSIRFDIGRLENEGREIHPDMRAREQRFTEAHQRIEARWQATVDRAQAAHDVAHPLLLAEGYPFGWWNTGTMRIPPGEISPGHDRLRRR